MQTYMIYKVNDGAMGEKLASQYIKGYCMAFCMAVMYLVYDV